MIKSTIPSSEQRSGNPLRKLSHWLAAHTNRYTLALSFLCSAIIIAIFRSDLPLTGNALIALTGGGLLDVEFWHSAADTLQRLTLFGETGRQIYLRFIVLDFVFIPAYTLALSFLLGWLSRRGAGMINLLPLLVGACDVVENSCHLVLILLFPDMPVFMAVAGSCATVLKFAFLMLTFVALLVMLADRFRQFLAHFK